MKITGRLASTVMFVTDFWPCGAWLRSHCTVVECHLLGTIPVLCLLQQIFSHNLGTEPSPFLGLNGSYFYILQMFFLHSTCDV